MNYFSLNELQRKDLLTALGLWLTIELVSFVLFPMLGLIDPDARLRTWFLISVPLGVGGAILIGASSRSMAVLSEKGSKRTRLIQTWMAQFGSWVGLAGIMFPFVMVCREFFATLKL